MTNKLSLRLKCQYEHLLSLEIRKILNNYVEQSTFPDPNAGVLYTGPDLNREEALELDRLLHAENRKNAQASMPGIIEWAFYEGGHERNTLELLRPDCLPGICLEYSDILAKEDKRAEPDAARPELILASASPRRRELLDMTGLAFTVQAADIDEEETGKTAGTRAAGETDAVRTALAVRAIAEEKARKIYVQSSRLPARQSPVVLAADTIVYNSGVILGKPKHEADAVRMLRSLAGHEHQVITAAAIAGGGKLESFVSVTRVRFFPWDRTLEALARQTASSGSALDKAGAYGIQEAGGFMIQGIEGDYYTVVGLPLAEVWRRLKLYYPD